MRIKALAHVIAGAPFGQKEIELLRLIQEHGSISKAAKAYGISYKSAWDLLRRLDREVPEPLLRSKMGGSGGGGSELTTFGQEILRRYELIQRSFDLLAKELESCERIEELEVLCDSLNLARPLSNRLKARIKKIKCKERMCTLWVSVDRQELKLKSSLEKASALKEGMLVWICFDPKATSKKDSNCLKGIFLRTRGEMVEALVGEWPILVTKPYRLKNGMVEFCLRAKDIEVCG